jgi:broad specificity phosphatase PhoE
MTTTRVLLIAPALSPALREARFGEAAGRGSEDDDALDPTGLRQAEAVREPFPHVSGIYASPSRRCLRTARALGLDAAPLTALAPCAMGRWQGRTLDEVAAEEPASVAAWLADPAAAPHGGESLLALLTRVGQWLDALLATRPDALPDTRPDARPGDPHHRGGRVLAVADPDLIRAAAVHALGAPPEAFWRIDMRPLSVTELSGRAGRWNLLGGRPLHTGPQEQRPYQDRPH